MNETHYIYILASKRRGALYVDTTDDLADRVLQHRANLIEGLTSRYAIHRLVYYEIRAERGAALLRANEIRNLPRGLKLQLVESINSGWCELFDEVTFEYAASAGSGR